ncbi:MULTISPECIES: ACT domain-containing protein [Clostridium]|jgi:acetolactate synthase-1/3 small subunit|uniref:acetolactate synthase n=1 Tax=Clostridium saccharoperbutylacetonicum N1-4(HMT) TaxID=931276 RepID=M1MGB7_9CLOT|nr:MULTISPECIES: ACT domain-containing protein [Clostridium]AGF56964.1 acetolactate synthase, small subunit [Clostridium saccharoperbutylacetonicum N1-4(HMT)]AQR95694.1 acetolactate synthase isozyme 1 small subunit [Clostridium saccharoperbutylacetonicum]NRT62277.1 acetolactate synthase-1/3 small subunit [Clostridium saccharoperbutylacetonicum]NSB25613.1 acetolactate synthase-1/3 small subunit [Clostridium saccharoperbutylacetonicum]NSB31557.1 acetolactate synthase-1/3 small subunit [Clostridi
MINTNSYLIELHVRNHAGVMSHITGLFARRAFNLEGILCAQIGDGSTSKMYLLVKNDFVLDQIIKQLEKLYDVLDVTLHQDYDQSVFENLDKVLKLNTNGDNL